MADTSICHQWMTEVVNPSIFTDKTWNGYHISEISILTGYDIVTLLQYPTIVTPLHPPPPDCRYQVSSLESFSCRDDSRTTTFG